VVVYVDTSVIVTAIDKGDIKNPSAEKFLLREREKIISPLVLVEIFSVVSRNYERLISKFDVRIDERDLPAVIARLSMRKYNLNLIYPFEKELTIFGEVPAEIKLAFMLSHKLKLRTPDLLHLSIAWYLKLNGHSIDGFATFDSEILKKAEKVENLTDIRVFEP